jgi:VWFA-related protein
MDALLLIACCVIAQAAPQTAPPPFRAATHLIVQTVSVKDKQGRPVTGLTSSDFIVTENGQFQQIAFVEYEPLDASPGDVPSVSARAASSPVTNTSAAEPPLGDVRYRGRRLIVLYFDLYNMGFFDQLRAYASANNYIASGTTPADLVAIVVFQNGAVQTKIHFTDDRAALIEAIRQLEKAADDAANGHGLTIRSGSGFGEDDDTFNLFATDRQLAAIQTAVADLGPLPEVKTLIYLGSGLRLNGADNQAQLRATVNAAVRANVTINPIDTRGLVARPPLGDATRASPGGSGMFDGTLAQAGATSEQQAEDTYYALAKDTGGFAFFDHNDLALGIRRAAQAVTGYYMVGYYTSNDALDGRFRRVKVGLTNGRQADLTYRAGYFGAKDYAKFNAFDKERQLEEALKADDPITNIPLAVEANYFQINADEYFVPISVRMPADELIGSRGATTVRTEIDMIGEIKDDYGVTVRNARDKIALTFDAGPPARRAIQYETGFTLLPGTYTIKILARDARTGRIGTFVQSFTVPNLEREEVRLRISSLVIATQRTSRRDAIFNVKEAAASDVGNPLVQGGRKLIPSVTRTFRRSQTLFLFLQSYDSSMHPVVAFVAFYRDSAKAFESEPLTVTRSNPQSRAISIDLTVPLAALEAGSYDCQVTVLDPDGRRAAFSRTAIAVQPR